MSALEQLETLEQLLARLKLQQLTASDFSRQVMGMQTLTQALPERYGQVLQGLLDRLESGALFTEESCSFSASQLHDSLALWAQ
jgi:hypothetical protein